MLLREYSFTADPLETVQFQLAIVVRVSESQSDFFWGGPAGVRPMKKGADTLSGSIRRLRPTPVLSATTQWMNAPGTYTYVSSAQP